jgi:hypothetical protein
MIDLPKKTRHAVEMAVAARALAAAAPTDHRKRVLARYVFVYLHDVIRFAPAWRNALVRDPRSRATAEAAKPALERLRRDWETYADIRHYLAAKRQPRHPGDKAADQLAAFRLWADIGDLSVETLTDDALEIYAQLADEMADNQRLAYEVRVSSNGSPPQHQRSATDTYAAMR